MSIESMTICRWFDRTKEDCVVEEPSWPDVIEAMRQLNNGDFNDIYLEPRRDDPETYLCIGGGNGRYVVTGSIENEEYPTLVDESKSESAEVNLVVGGQEGAYPGNMIVNFDAALIAAKDFYEYGGFGGETPWRK